MPYDVRSVANYVLDLAESDGQTVSNLSVNKIVFFLHALFLVQFGRPLVSAKIEAWEYGPVFRELYREFKSFGEKPILRKARRISPETGLSEPCTYEFRPEELDFLTGVARRYISLTAGTLVAISHEKGGPWDQVWNHDKAVNASMNISNEIIRDWYAKAARH
jgi:uncharacterized phage-associated protein